MKFQQTLPKPKKTLTYFFEFEHILTFRIFQNIVIKYFISDLQVILIRTVPKNVLVSLLRYSKSIPIILNKKMDIFIFIIQINYIYNCLKLQATKHFKGRQYIPVHLSKTNVSAQGIIFFKSPTVKVPLGVIVSLRRVPEFIITQSALSVF